jgi:hypothetical protein
MTDPLRAFKATETAVPVLSLKKRNVRHGNSGTQAKNTEKTGKTNG